MESSIILSEEQKKVLSLVKRGKNVYIYGPGGTGKSEIIKEIKKYAEEVGKNIAICALTGCAAVVLDCNARTLHSWGGIGLAEGSIEDVVQSVVESSYKRKVWRDVEILVIDEVSMMEDKILDTISDIAKACRHSVKPMGGIQVIMSGDFYQLPPVKKNMDGSSTFCFKSVVWNELFPARNCVELVKIYRQKDPIYSKILNQMRIGRMTQKSIDLLQSYVGRKPDENCVVKPTILFPLRSSVDNTNIREMCRLSGQEYTYEKQNIINLPMTDKEIERRSSFTKKQIEYELMGLRKNLRCDDEVVLKIGAQVMHIVNINDDTSDFTLCNGTQGVVIGMTPGPEPYPIVRFVSGKKTFETTVMPYIWKSSLIPGIGVSQIPLILAWALTIHKAQGASLDSCQIDAGSQIFECGQTYVEFSRLKSLDGLYLIDFDFKKIMINADVREFYENLKKRISELPEVEESETSIFQNCPRNNRIRINKLD